MPRSYLERGITWGELNRRILVHMRECNWGKYRWDRFQMGEFLRDEGRLDESLRFYLEVCYLDFNGPTDNGDYSNPASRPAFIIPKYAQIFAPAVLEVVSWIQEKRKLTQEQLREIFMAQAQIVADSLRPPRPPAECWSALERELT